MLLALVNATLSGIYTAAVYRYAAEGDVSAGFEPEMVRDAFRPEALQPGPALLGRAVSHLPQPLGLG